MVSSGVMWSQPVKERLLDHLPQVLIFDSLGSSEAVGMAASLSSKGTVTGTARFALGDRGRRDHRRRPHGGARLGRDRSGGGQRPAARSATTRTRSRRRPPSRSSTACATRCPGDWATVEADGTVTLLGRGSVCINTGGEKVFPEEVEEVLKTARAWSTPCRGRARRALRRGDQRRRRAAGGTTIDAGRPDRPRQGPPGHYKAPRRVVAIDTIGRAPNGKVDYKRLKAHAVRTIGVNAT